MKTCVVCCFSSHDLFSICSSIVEEIIADIQKNEIHPPSTFRMLRLLLAKRCERMDRCFGLNLDTLLPRALVIETSRPFGLAMCFDCYVGIISHCGNSKAWYTKEPGFYGFLREPHFESVTGVPVGSIITLKHIRRVENTLTCPDCRVERLDQIRCEPRSAEESRRRTELIEAFEQAMKERAGNERAEESSKRAQDRPAKIALLKKLGRQLEDYEFKEWALAHSWKNNGDCFLRYGVSRSILLQLLVAPNDASPRMINKVANALEQAFNVLRSNGFVPDPSLRIRDVFQLPPDAPPSHKALYEYMDFKYPIEYMLQMACPWRHLDVLYRLRQGDPWIACCSLLSQRDYKNAFRRAASLNIFPEWEKTQSLFEYIWDRDPLTGVSRVPCLTLAIFQKRFSDCLQQSKDLLDRIREFSHMVETTSLPGGEFLKGLGFVNVLLCRDWVTPLMKRNFNFLGSRHRMIVDLFEKERVGDEPMDDDIDEWDRWDKFYEAFWQWYSGCLKQVGKYHDNAIFKADMMMLSCF
jgi:hypothetical protein